MNTSNERYWKYRDECAESYEFPADNEVSMEVEYHPATLSDLHRFMNVLGILWEQYSEWIAFDCKYDDE